MKFEQWKDVISTMAQTVIDNEKHLCELDAYVGDGDHGRTVARGFRAVQEYLTAAEENDFCTLTSKCGKILGKSMGGAIGPIFESVFTGFAEGCEDVDDIDVKRLSIMFANGLEEAEFLGGAKEGDKTLIDTLGPAARSLSDSADKGLSMVQALEKLTSVAKNACLSTTDMIARKGRAKFLGEGSRGHQDAGATTMFLLIEAINKAYKGE